ncbi:MAG TPA: hypothetical protein VGY54_10435 [Polyangiaceae bacterium]|jgi:hypothetical protein|nr:hypothetical protein [Polyangiaceae bacterium]
MIRHIGLSTFALLLSASSLACDKPGVTELQQEDKANRQAAQAQAAASEQAQNAQEAADNDIAGARASFDKTREDYRHSRTVDLSDLDKKIADLEAKAKTSTGKARANLGVDLPGIRAKRQAFAQDLESSEIATAATWDEAKANLDKDWDTLKGAVNKAQ